MLRPLSVGEILDTSFSLYRRHFGALATVSLVCTGLPLVLRLFVEASGGLFANLTLVLLYFLCLVVLSLVAPGPRCSSSPRAIWGGRSRPGRRWCGPRRTWSAS
jgi:hypothetical protein